MQVVDSAGHSYCELPLSPTEYLRVTLLPAEEAARDEPSVRLQVRPEGSAPRPGPEVPLRLVAALGQAVDELRALLKPGLAG